jgi:predicted phosphodiesterase
MTSNIKTRFLILSDTHGMDFSPADKPRQGVDVAIHCGDLTDGSTLKEFRTAMQLLKDIDAPLKLAIAGNHDFTMDIPAFQRIVAEANPPLEPELVARDYGVEGEARKMFEEEAKKANIFLLDEGTHRFTLDNGALLTVYASPYTPSCGAWGFQYHPNQGHNFQIENGTDVVITHGPPKGVMDHTHGRERAGCQNLFAAIARARPRIHCFGHIHEGWGARMVTWQDDYGEEPNHFTAFNNDKSRLIEKLATLAPSRFDSPEDVEEKARKLEHYRQERCCTTSHCVGDEFGSQTLFVNASISGIDDTLVQKPWLVEIELPKAT